MIPPERVGPGTEPCARDLAGIDWAAVWQGLAPDAVLVDPGDTAGLVWAWKDDGIVHISGAGDHGIFHCIDCGAPLEVVSGTLRARQFRHRAAVYCPGRSGKTLLHLMAREVVREAGSIGVPELLRKSVSFPDIRRTGWTGGRMDYCDAETDPRLTCPDGAPVIPDVRVRHAEGPACIEIRLRQAVDDEKKRRLALLDVDVLGIDLALALAGTPYGRSDARWAGLRAEGRIDDGGRMTVTRDVLRDLVLQDAKREWLFSRVERRLLEEIRAEERPRRIRDALGRVEAAVDKAGVAKQLVTSKIRAEKVWLALDYAGLAAGLSEAEASLPAELDALRQGVSDHEAALAATDESAAADAARFQRSLTEEGKRLFAEVTRQWDAVQDLSSGLRATLGRAAAAIAGLQRRRIAAQCCVTARTEVSEGLGGVQADLATLRGNLDLFRSTVSPMIGEGAAPGEGDVETAEGFARSVTGQAEGVERSIASVCASLDRLAQEARPLASGADGAVDAGIGDWTAAASRLRQELPLAVQALDACREAWEKAKVILEADRAEAVRQLARSTATPAAAPSAAGQGADALQRPRKPKRCFTAERGPDQHPGYGRRMSDLEIEASVKAFFAEIRRRGIPEIGFGAVMACRPDWLLCESIHDALAFRNGITEIWRRMPDVVELALRDLEEQGP
ncbi:hypothetical protein LAZ40_06710 [Cereibacter sphaeroides]|uniref:hypothetical protein n=1 Tax=Cereibacter sphaeroides TaxID=1063 RepID=UPI001F3854C5|nr:hypothetical protein [Cereibacter sphaeroides]MCE6958737.1 hypothetical protein [Cereibacter sphaeroides]MCE6973389.1 hypothetical protein [Cereibacter sphaeroides]